jgi:NADH:ubiquinone oxidoreductase subunit F (NADH-binding)
MSERLITAGPRTGAARLTMTSSPGLAAHLGAYGPLPTPAPRHGARPGALVDELERAGLRGRGGGWFPTHIKMRGVVESSAKASVLSRKRHPVAVANAMEGEPASHKDAALLASQPHLVIDGLVLAAQAIGATDAVIAVHRGSAVEAAVARALAERSSAAIDSPRVRLVTPPARYVASEESALAHWIGDGTATPVFEHRPFQRGVSGRPTLVQNAETLAHIALIARFGAEWFAGVGAPSAPGTTLVSVGGQVAQPQVVEVPTGTPVAEILDLCGGPTSTITGYLTGGYGGAWVAAAGFAEVAWQPDTVQAAGGVIGASILWAVGEGSCPIVDTARIATWMAGESAGQCGPCLFGLPSVAGDMRLLADRHASPETIARLRSRLQSVSGRGGCKLPDGAVRLVTTGLDSFQDEVALHLSGSCSADHGPRLSRLDRMPVPPVRNAIDDHTQEDLR